MMKIGSQATYYNMGGCPEVLTEGSCENDIVPGVCDPYLVDIGAHWELSSANQGTTYAINIGDDTATASQQEAVPINGKDLVAGKDDEYAASAYCRLDDNGDGAGNEWAGAWAHTSNSTVFNNAQEDKYIFELSRLLKTMSPTTDAQLAAGESYEFGLAYWDPYETEAEGWTDAGHYVTGCAAQWNTLTLESGSNSSFVAATKLMVSALLFATSLSAILA